MYCLEEDTSNWDGFKETRILYFIDPISLLTYKFLDLSNNT